MASAAFGTIAGMVFTGASTTAVRAFCSKASIVSGTMYVVSKATVAGHSAWLSNKAYARRLSLERPVHGAYLEGPTPVEVRYNGLSFEIVTHDRTYERSLRADAMVVRARNKQFYTLIVESELETVTDLATVHSGDFIEPEIRSRVVAVRIAIVKGEVEETRLLDGDLPVVWMHDGRESHYAGKGADDVDQELPFFEEATWSQEKEYLGMSQCPKDPDVCRIDALEVPAFGRFESGTVMLDRQGDESHVVILPNNAVDDVETYRGSAVDKAKNAMAPDRGIAIRLPKFWKLPEISAR